MKPLAFGLFALLVSVSAAQDRLAGWPVQARMQKDGREQRGTVKLGVCERRWTADGKLGYDPGDGWKLLDPATGKETRIDKAPERAAAPPSGRSRRSPGRGGQYSEVFNGDGKVKAWYKDGNVSFQKEGEAEAAVTTDGDLAKRVKYGKGSWVYGEELNQSEAMGLNAKGDLLWYYRFDETPVVDNMVVFKQATAQPVFEPQAYPKPGGKNPVVDVFVYDAAKGKSVQVQVRPGPFDDGIGHYVYDVQWAPDGSELRFRRTDRRQKVMEYCAADPSTGVARVIVREEWPASYVENKLGVWSFDSLEGVASRPELKGKVLWEHQRNGFLNVGILDPKTGAFRPVTANGFDMGSVVRIDVSGNRLYYMARNGDNPYLEQLMVVGLDGKGNRRVTDPSLNHRVELSPDGRYAVDVAQSCQDAPVTRLIDLNGKVIKVLAESDLSQFRAAGYAHSQRVEFTGGDGKTKICGTVSFPRNFDPSKKYPLLVSVYGGPIDPHSSGFSETFQPYNELTGYGFIVASFDNRGTGGRGKAFSDPLYRNMGIAEIDDQAAGVKALVSKGYVDPTRIGIQGTSYGGYASIMCLLRYPDLYKAACSSSGVTDWHNYDTIYTERYMGLADENKDGYTAGSAMTYAEKLKGWLMLYYGTADENVHPCNSLQLVSAFRRLGKGIEVQVGTDLGHTGVDFRRMMEFFFERMDVPHG
ncbi:MAG: S9 family peptidase [Armatimonadetes bacterium]|nr:S9 family peptidase [Armatimonadota bacterium]